MVGRDPNESKVRATVILTDQKMVDLAQIIQGISDPDEIDRIDTDWERESRNGSDDRPKDAWVVFYSTTSWTQALGGLVGRMAAPSTTTTAVDRQ